jgi:hypothetical protein
VLYAVAVLHAISQERKKALSARCRKTGRSFLLIKWAEPETCDSTVSESGQVPQVGF